ncbi:precorrin-3B C(17)-methyltransferase [Minwuia sp.]|uniref:precorrin-3B C(17)-methyltransferase n=1 Tax=Minwuia sp. TaxID=2493630 RepID=UPI003A933169
MKPVIIALDARGAALASSIAPTLGAETHGLAGRVEGLDHAFDRVGAHLADLFLAGRPIVGICAAGILIRALDDLPDDKHLEPPVIALSNGGESVVPLLGGHRGANELALQIATITGGHAAITTAGDVIHGAALDVPPTGWRLANPGHARDVMARIVGGAAFRVEGDLPFDLHRRASARADLCLMGTDRPATADKDTLVYHPQRHVIGVGSARGCPSDELSTLVRSTLVEHGIAEGAVACIASIDLKADERAMLELAEALDVPFRLFDAAALEAMTSRLANPSDVVFAEVGCHGVAEGAALAGAGSASTLMVEKRKSANATVAIARAPEVLDPSVIGRARGAVHVVGIGPGKADWRTPEAGRLIAHADEVVGYDLYLDLVASLVPEARRTTFPLGQETERCAYALERAGEGRTVALISSGDAGIYAMAALVEELVADAKVSAAARRVAVTVTPGVSALQAAAARSGAPLGHDFCAISLSDLLTPWAAIERRVRAAAEGDFVIAFYNPVSKRRRTQLAAAREILLDHRPPGTPVVLATDLGRPKENVRVTTLGDLDIDDVDMLTTVMVGSTATRTYQSAGRTRVFTPRGYAAKEFPK